VHGRERDAVNELMQYMLTMPSLHLLVFATSLIFTFYAGNDQLMMMMRCEERLCFCVLCQLAVYD